MQSAAEKRNAYWGITIKNGEKISVTFKHGGNVICAVPYHGWELDKDEEVSIWYRHDDDESRLFGNLTSRKKVCINYKLHFNEGEKGTFYHTGKGSVYVQGYIGVVDSDDESGYYLDKDSSLDEELSGFKKCLTDKNSEKPSVKIKDKAEGGYDGGVSSLPIGKGGASKISSKVIKGVTIEDIKVGRGWEAKEGIQVQVYYTGTLESGKVFDCVTVAPYSFRLGQKSVIRGLNVGVEGMKIGGERRLIIPPDMGYGSRPVGRVPPNSTLYYEVELVSMS